MMRMKRGAAAPEEKTAGRGRRSGVRAALAAAAALAAVAALIALSVTPPAFTDGQTLALLPAGAELLGRHEMSRGREQRVEYRYTEEHRFCLVERTEQTVFRYEKGTWRQAGEPEVLTETEDWSGLAGCWTEQTEGPEGRFLQVRVDGFDGVTLAGQVLYQDEAASCEGLAEDLFGPGQRADSGLPWVLKGTGFFRYNYLRVDRDGGLYFDNDLRAMERSDLPSELPAPMDPEADEKLLESVTGDTGGTWLIATAELGVSGTPGPDGESLGTAAVGTALVCLDAQPEDGWYRVAYDAGAGYVPADGVLELTEDMTVGVVTAVAAVNVRTGPGTEYDRLDAVGAGARMVYTALEDGWYRVIYGGADAYVAGDYVLAEPLVLPET